MQVLTTYSDLAKGTQTNKWKKLADTWFSRMIRLQGADSNGMCKCISCEKLVHIKKIQCGHFVSRRKLSTRFLKENCFPQCYACNVGQNGNYASFARQLQETYGSEIIKELDEKSKKLQKMSAVDYLEIIGECMHQVNCALCDKGIEKWWNETGIEKTILKIYEKTHL